MTVFISYSFENQPEFGNVIDSLDRVGVPYWQPTEIKSGASLRRQLRDALQSCSVCIFVATHNSVKSSWCGAELGAFWGAALPIIVYLAESSLPEDKLPPILQGDVWERKLSAVASRAAELDQQSRTVHTGGPTVPSGHLIAMTAEQIEELIAGGVSLVQADESVPGDAADDELQGSIALDAAKRILRARRETSRVDPAGSDGWRRKILWVDDRPDNNIYEREAFAAVGFTFDLSHSTEDALQRLASNPYGAIISDMGRKEGQREGYRLLDALRSSGDRTPFFIYAGSSLPEHKRETVRHGGQGCTNMVNELMDMVVDALRCNGH